MTPTISPTMKYALGAALGAAGMYWFDARHRVPGATARTRSLIRSNDVSDEVLSDRIRSALGRATSHAGAIEVSCSQGIVTLRGAVLKHEHPRVMRAARSAAGVSEVHDELAAYKRADGAPELLENWSPTARLLACASGASLALWSLRQPPAIAVVATAIGSALIARGVSNMPLSRLGGTGRRTIETGVPAGDTAAPRAESAQEPWQSHVSAAAAENTPGRV